MDPRGFPTTLPEFQRVFPHDTACATYLEKLRWPSEFACPKCGVTGEEPYRFANRPHVLRCPMTAFNSLLGIGAKTVTPTYAELYSGAWEHPGSQSRDPQIEMPFA